MSRARCRAGSSGAIDKRSMIVRKLALQDDKKLKNAVMEIII